MVDLVKINLPGGRALVLTEDNAHIYTFGEEYARYNHVYVVPDAEDKRKSFYIFDNQTLLDRMFETDAYPHTSAPRPQECDKVAFRRHQTRSPLTQAEIALFVNYLEVQDVSWHELRGIHI